MVQDPAIDKEDEMQVTAIKAITCPSVIGAIMVLNARGAYPIVGMQLQLWEDLVWNGLLEGHRDWFRLGHRETHLGLAMCASSQ